METTTAPHPGGQDRARERFLGWVLLLTLSFVYLYFFQGGGWNQNSRLATIRAIVEDGSLEITRFNNTADASSRDSIHFYSNKPPGYALLGVPVYAVLYGVERLFRMNVDNLAVVNFNSHVLSFWLSGLPTALLGWMIYRGVLRMGRGPGESMLIAGAFGLGTYVLPYTGTLSSHGLTAALIFGAWFLLSRPERPGPRTILLVGVLMGAAAAVEYLAAPLVLLFAAWAWRERGPRGAAASLLAPAAWAAILLACNYLAFRKWFITANTYQNRAFVDANLFLGVFDGPDWHRIYWLTLHPMRGWIYNSPLLGLGVIGLVFLRPIRKIDFPTLVPLIVIFYFFFLNLCFNGWSGGWGFGARYLMPAAPFLYLYGVPLFWRVRWAAWTLAACSVVAMFVVASVLLMWAGPSFGPPADTNPLLNAFRAFRYGQVAVAVQGMMDVAGRNPANATPDDFWKSYNLGEVVGLRGPGSVVPCALVILGFFLFGWRAARKDVTCSVPGATA